MHIGLTRRRQEALRARLDEWLGRRPRPGGPAQVIAEPRELAVLLGHLVLRASGQLLWYQVSLVIR